MYKSKEATVSVIIPLYNKGKYVERTITSVLAQTYQPYEIIVVDDGSTDDGPEKVLKLNNPRIILVRQDNRGPGAARNAGLAMAKGKYVSFLDADDEWYSSFLGKGISYLDNNRDVGAAITGYHQYPSMRMNSEGLMKLQGIYEITPDTNIDLVRDIVTYSSLCFAVIRTAIARRWGGYFDRIKCTRGEDAHLFLKLLFNEKIAIIPEPHGLYHTEASDLCGRGYSTIPPLEPFLMDPYDIVTSCPPAKRHILREFLSRKALGSAVMYAKLGQKKIAKDLLDRFCSNGTLNATQVLKGRILADCAPVLPSVRRVWSLAKSIAGK